VIQLRRGQSLAWSMIQVGWAYESGNGTRLDRLRAEDWYWKALERGSDFALLRVGCLAFRRGDPAKARAILGVGVARGLTPAMRSLAGIELRVSKSKDARRRAYALYEQAIELGDGSARIDLARAMALGCFGLRAIPAGIRSLPAAVAQISAQIGTKSDAPAFDPKLKFAFLDPVDGTAKDLCRERPR
jgi:TPR repeat protein